MLLYGFVALFPLIVRYIYITTHGSNAMQSEDRPKILRYIIISAIPMFLLIALRSNMMGNDTAAYMKFFYELKNIDFENIFNKSLRFGLERLEIGYLVFTKLTGYLTDSGLVYQIFYTLVYFVSILFFVYHEKADPFLTLFFFATLGTYMFYFTGVRQCLAMSVCLFAYYAAKNKKWIMFALLVLLACTFHKSAVIFAFIPLILNRKIKIYNFIFYIAGSFVVVNALEEINAFVNDTLGYEYALEDSNNGYISFLVMLIIFIFSLMFMSRRKRTNDRDTKILINTSVLCVGLWLLRLFTRTAERPAFYFSFFLCALLSYTLCDIPKNKNKTIWILLVCGACMLLYLYKFTNTFRHYVPYDMF